MTSSTHSAAASLARFQTLLRMPTVSRLDESSTDWAVFDGFVAALPALYPALHAVLEREVVAGHSLLYRWAGVEPGDPAVLMAHYDVVPAGEEGWTHPPFAAELVGEGAEREVWGRGTLDDKGALAALLEAVEASVLAGVRPRRDVYLSFGHNEETSGTGAKAIVRTLRERGIRPAFVLDEGGAVVEGVFPGVRAPSAMIGVSEKGVTTITLTVHQRGGHASTPPRRTATDRLARAIVRLGRRPFPARITPTTARTLRTIGEHATGPMRFALTRQRLSGPLLLRVLARLGDETSAMVRTTSAVTQLQGSAAANVLAERAVATVNVRVAVGSSVAEALRHVRRAVRDSAVLVEALDPSEPSPVSPASGPAWELLSSTTTAIFGEVIVTPYVQLGASDSRHFAEISDHVYRFTPFEMTSGQRGSLHAVDERMHVDTWLRGIAFYMRLLRGL